MMTNFPLVAKSARDEGGTPRNKPSPPEDEGGLDLPALETSKSPGKEWQPRCPGGHAGDLTQAP